MTCLSETSWSQCGLPVLNTMAKLTNSRQKHRAAPMNKQVKVPVKVGDANGRTSLKLQVLTTQAQKEIQQRTQMEIEEQE